MARRSARGRFLVLIALVLGVVGGAQPPVWAAPVVVTFEGFQDSVTRIGEVTFVPSVEVGGCGPFVCPAHSGTQVARPPSDGEFARRPFAARFDMLQLGASMWIRSDAQFSSPTTIKAVLTAFRSDGSVAGQPTILEFPANAGWQQIGVQYVSLKPEIRSVRLQAGPINRPFTNFVAVDDLRYTASDSLDTSPPSIFVVEPDHLEVVRTASFDVEIEVNDGTDLSQITGRVLLVRGGTQVDALAFCGTAGTPACPERDGRWATFEGSATMELPDNSYYVVEITACDQTGNCATVRTKFARDVPPALSIARPAQPNVAAGGRAVAVDISPEDPEVAIAGTETGGLFKTTDGGTNWRHLGAFPGLYVGDVRFDADDADTVIATVTYDDSNPTRAGIWRSADGGETWARPRFDFDGNSFPEPWQGTGGGSTGPCLLSSINSAWGVSFLPGTGTVYAGLDCGLAVSQDDGANWTFEDVEATARRQIAPLYSVAAHHDVVDACGASGHWRRSLTDPAGVWTNSNLPEDGFCRAAAHAIAPHPSDPSVVFLSPSFMEPDSNGLPRPTAHSYEGHLDPATGAWAWIDIGAPQSVGREPFIRAHVSINGFLEVYFGNGVNLYRQDCFGLKDTSVCTPEAWTPVEIDHVDQSDIAYPTHGAACPALISSDGGMHAPADGACGSQWQRIGGGRGGFNALQIYDVAGTVRPSHTDLYFGTQDNGFFASAGGGFTWPNTAGAEGGLMQVLPTAGDHPSPDEIVTLLNCAPCGNGQTGVHLIGGLTAWPDPPSQTIPGNPFLVEQDVYVQLVDDQDLWLRENGDWRKAGKLTEDGVEILQVAGNPADPFVYAVEQDGGRHLVVGRNVRTRFSVVDASGKADDTANDDRGNNLGTLARRPFQFIWAEVFGVDRRRARRLIAADLNAQAMRTSSDFGRTWSTDDELTALIKGQDRLLPARTFAQTAKFLFNGRDGVRSQATEIAFDRRGFGRIFVGTQANGVFTTDDDGVTWEKIPGSDPIASATGFFFGDPDRDGTLVSSWGRGLWRVQLPKRDLSLLIEPSSPSVTEGSRLDYKLTVTNEGRSATPSSWAIVDVPHAVNSPGDYCSVENAPAPNDSHRFVYCFIPGLAPGAQARLDVATTVPRDYVPAGRDSRVLLASGRISSPLISDPDFDRFRFVQVTIRQST